MVSSDNSPIQDHMTPPGAVRLIGGLLSNSGTIQDVVPLTKLWTDHGTKVNEVMLHPTPSSDPNDPLNWSFARKSVNFLHTLIMTALVFTQLTIPTTFWQLWVKEFDCEYKDLTTALALMFVGTSTGCFLFIPFAVKFGRRPVYIASMAVMTAMSIWNARMHSLVELFVSQLLAGLAGGCNETIVQMTIADLYFVHQRGTANGVYMVLCTIGTFLSPIVAGAIARHGNWRFCYYTLFAFNATLMLCFVGLYEESKYIPHIQGHNRESCPGQEESLAADSYLGKKTEKSEVILEPTVTQESHLNPSIALLPWSQRLRLVTKTGENIFKQALEPFIVFFKFPAVIYTAIQYSFGLCWITILVSTTASTFPGPPYNFSPLGVGCMSIGPFLGSALGAIYAGYIGDWVIVWLARRNHGIYEPEMRLQLLHLPALCMGGGLVMYGLTVSRGMKWIYPSVGGGIFGFGVGSICDISLALVIDSYREVTGEAFVVVAFFRNVASIGILFGLVPWQKSQGLQNMFIVVAVGATVFGLFHLLLIKWGKGIRQHTAGSYYKMVEKKVNAR